jgi:hypothetical protein
MITLCAVTVGGAQTPPDVTPAGWRGPTPAAVLDREAAWQRQAHALRHAERALSVSLEADAEATRLRRFDPPREAATAFNLTPQMNVAWSPYRDRQIREAARLTDIEVDLVHAWNEAVIAPLAAAVRQARAQADLREAETALVTLKGAEPAAATAAHDAWRWDVQAAQLDAEEAKLALAGLPPDLPEARRVALALPQPRPAGALPSYHAARGRLEASMKLAERRWVAETAGTWTLEVGHAGSDADIEIGAGVRAGRPTVHTTFSLDGTDQERSFVELSGQLALSTHARRLRDAWDAAQAALDRFDAVEAGLRERQQQLDLERARLSREAWEIAEARLAQAQAASASNTETLEDRARRAWLRHARDAQRAWDAVERVMPAP